MQTNAEKPATDWIIGALAMGAADVFRFGAFELDSGRSRLYQGAQRLSASNPQLGILIQLVSKAPEVVSKEMLVDAGWPGVDVSPNSIDQAISRLRKLLGRQENGAPYIETATGAGYRFSAAVERAQRRDRDAPLDAQLSPYRAFVQGRANLETLDPEAIRAALRAFQEVVRSHPDYGPGHVGIANACSLLHESTWFDAHRDVSLVETAVAAAYRGCELEPDWAEAWSTLALALYQRGDTADAIAAACRAIDLDDEDWRHSLRLSYISWGEERLRGARRVLALCPNLALAHWLTTTVFIARGATESAFDNVRKGCTAEDAQVGRHDRFMGIGLHLLQALLLGASGRISDAFDELRRERACVAGLRHIYARLCAANVAYTFGALQRRLGNHDESDRDFAEALRIAPGHVFAAAALGRPPQPGGFAREPNTIDVEMATAIYLAREGRHPDAARICSDAVVKAPPGYAGWILPVEPFLDAAARPDIWAHALSTVSLRAT